MRFLAFLFCALLASSGAVAQEDDLEKFKARRDALKEQLGDAVAVIYGASAGDSLRGGAFRQDSTFFYLTGVSDAGAALILAPGEKPYDEILYLQPRNPEMENIDGRRLPLGSALEEATGFEAVGRTNFLPYALTRLMQKKKVGAFLGPIVPATAPIPESLSILRDAAARVPGSRIENQAGLIDEMRRIKDDYEIAAIQRAVDITGMGIVAAMLAVEPDMSEFQLQSVLESTYRREGAQFVGFSTIVASGGNTTVLHYVDNDEPIGETGLVLIDTGAEWEHYTADVTRTFPASGRFSARERELYEIVLEAQRAAIERVRADAIYFEDVHMTARQVIEDAGYGDYFIHGTGHFVGLDVHDVGDYGRPMSPGVVLTVEPGIYIPEEGIGIRIEDVVLVTDDEPIVMSRNIPRTVEEIERLMADRPMPVN